MEHIWSDYYSIFADNNSRKTCPTDRVAKQWGKISQLIRISKIKNKKNLKKSMSLNVFYIFCIYDVLRRFQSLMYEWIKSSSENFWLDKFLFQQKLKKKTNVNWTLDFKSLLQFFFVNEGFNEVCDFYSPLVNFECGEFNSHCIF